MLIRRTNEPARDERFVPGGRVRKGETLEATVHRVARQEFGVEVEICGRLGEFEHFYETAEEGAVGGKHYVPIGFVVETDETLVGDDQHDVVRAFEPQDLPSPHQYVRTYLDEAGVLPDA